VTGAVRTRLRTLAGSRFGGLPRPFWIVFAGMIANRVGNMVVPFLVFYLGSRGIPPGQTAAVAVALGVGGVAGPALGGLLADRVGRRFTFVSGLLLTPVALGALFAAPGVAPLAVAAAFVGLTTGLAKPAAAALVTDVVAPVERMKAFSLIHWAINIGTAVASAAAGFLAVRGYWLLFVIDGATCAVFAVIVLAGVPAERHTAAVRAARRGGYGVVVRDRLMVAYLAINALGITVYTQTEFAIPLAIRLDGLAPLVFGLVGMLNALLVIALQPTLFGWLVRHSRIRVLAAAWLLIGAGVAGTGLADRPWQYCATAVVWTVGEVAHGAVSGAIVADLAPPEARGRYQGAFAWVWAVARLAAPAVAAGLLATVGLAALWWGCVVVGLFTAALTLRLTGALRRRTAPDTEPPNKPTIGLPTGTPVEPDRVG